MGQKRQILSPAKQAEREAMAAEIFWISIPPKLGLGFWGMS